MLCERCGANNAEVHLVRIVNGKRAVDYLCRQCAKEVIPFDEAAKMMKMTFSLEGILDLQEALKDLILPAMTGMNDDADIELTCPHCGEAISWSMLVPTEKKCAEKVPCAESTGAPAVKKDKLSLLRSEMTEAVKSENYELAAQIRDQIKDLEEKTEKEKDA
ncbi:MAG: UvrB/UvrC motif-containing protein [Synergistaceae bacterium]